MRTLLHDFITKSTGDYVPVLLNSESYSTTIEEPTSQKEKFIKFLNLLSNTHEISFFKDSEMHSTAGTEPGGFSIHSVPPYNATALPPEIRNNDNFMIKRRMISIIQSCYFEAGIWTEADEYFESLMLSKDDVANSLSILADIANHNLLNDHILEGILHILSHYTYDELDPFGISISLTCALNHSPVIQDLLISCFEKWDAIDAIDILESLKLEEPWLIDYRDEVVEQLRKKEMSA